MKIVVGLGNPGKEYQDTRHNTGFVFVEKLAKNKTFSNIGEESVFKNDKKNKAETLKIKRNGREILFVKPQTFMNNSGQAVVNIVNYYKLVAEDIIIVFDDKDLPLGQVRIRDEGGSAGHKGLQSVIDSLGTNKFTRIRIGIGQNRGNQNEIDENNNLIETDDYVLSQFSKREIMRIDKVIAGTIEYLLRYLFNKNDEIPSHTLNIE